MAAQQYRDRPQSAELQFKDDDDADDSNDSDEEDGDGENSGYAEEEKVQEERTEEEGGEEQEEEEDEEDLVGSDKEYKCDEADSSTDSEIADSSSKSKRGSKSGSARGNPKKKTVNTSGRQRWEKSEEIALLEWKTKKISTEITKLLPHKQKSQIKEKLKTLRKKFQRQMDSKKNGKFKNSDEKKLYELSTEIWGGKTTATTTTRTACNKKAGQEEKSKYVVLDDAEEMVLINDDAVLKGFDEYLSSRSIQISDEKERMKLETQYRKLAYRKATYNLAIAKFAKELLQHKLKGYKKD